LAAKNPTDLPDDLARALREAAGAIVSFAQPEQVLLFGPWAAGPDPGDVPVDIMVIADTGRRPMLTMQLAELVRPLLLPRECNVIVVRTEDWHKYRATPGFLTYDVDRKGVRLYPRGA
jgi:hypothetical protein